MVHFIGFPLVYSFPLLLLLFFLLLLLPVVGGCLVVFFLFSGEGSPFIMPFFLSSSSSCHPTYYAGQHTYPYVVLWVRVVVHIYNGIYLTGFLLFSSFPHSLLLLLLILTVCCPWDVCMCVSFSSH